jgi:hypothetical protein
MIRLSIEAVQFVAQHMSAASVHRPLRTLPADQALRTWLMSHGFTVALPSNSLQEHPATQPATPAPARRAEDSDTPEHHREAHHHPSRPAYAEQQAETDGPGQPSHHVTVVLAYEPGTRSQALATGPLVQFLQLLDYPVECAEGLNAATECLVRRGGQRCVLVTVWTLDLDGPAASAALANLLAHAHGVPSAILIETDGNGPVGVGFSSAHRSMLFTHSHVGDALLPLLKWLRDGVR